MVTVNKELEVKLKDANEANRLLQEELTDTNRGLVALAMELERENDKTKAMTQQLWHVAKLATMGELAASIAHELNNPLATVSLRVELLMSQIAQEDSNYKSLAVISKEVERMGNLVKNLLEFSRRGHRRISTIDIRKEIDGTLELIEYHLKKKNILILQAFHSNIPPICADRQQIRQLFLNLFNNASDAMPQGGILEITVELEDHADELILIKISDNGTGIPPEDMPRLMEPFFTTKKDGKGTGLGLSICRRIVQEHKGSIQFTSEINKGTTVFIRLPSF